MGQHVVYMEFKNDFLNYKGHGTDKYFTAGVTSGGLIDLKQNASHYLTISLSQNMYTPSNIRLAPEAISPSDYPYAGLISFNLGYQIFNPSNTAYTKGEFSWGTTGASSGARMIQRELHKIIGDREPNGWSTQVQLGNFIQTQIEYTRSILKSSWMKINCVGNIHLGSIFNTISVASEFKLDNSNDPFIGHFPKRVQPYGKPHLSLWARPKLAYVFSNLLLETNPNQAGPNLRTMNRIVYYSSVGISLQFNKVSISLIQHSNSPEFKTATKHAFGEIAFQLNI
jgi:lipid A 3-O-deacylase